MRKNVTYQQLFCPGTLSLYLLTEIYEVLSGSIDTILRLCIPREAKKRTFQPDHPH